MVTTIKTCDLCGYTEKASDSDMDAFVSAFRDWSRVRTADGWMDICLDCIRRAATKFVAFCENQDHFKSDNLVQHVGRMQGIVAEIRPRHIEANTLGAWKAH